MDTMIFGSGSPAVQDMNRGTTIEFDYGESVISWIDEYEDIRTLDGRVHRFYDGSRIRIRLQLKNILEDAEYNRLYALMVLLNNARSSGAAVRVIPHNSGIDPKGFECHVPVGFDLERLSRMSVGQKVELVFEGTHRFSGVRPYRDQVEPVAWELAGGGKLELIDGNSLEFGN